MKTKLIILSSSDIFFTLPLHNSISKDKRINIQKIFILKEKNHLIKKIKIFFLLNFRDYFKVFKKIIKSFYIKKEFSNYEYFSNVNSLDILNSINNKRADLVICINCPQILSEKTIKGIKAPIYNFHPGDIPSFRGVLIPYFLLKNNKKRACLTFHKIDQYIDKGKILNKNFINLKSKDTIFSIYEKIFLSEKSIKFIISSIVSHRKSFYTEIQSNDNYYSYPSVIEILKFRFGLK